MRYGWMAAAVMAAMTAVGFEATPAVADPVCDAPLADWRPRQALQAKLEADGWTVIAIRVDDGCYKVRATNARGERLEAKFDPASLDLVRRKEHRRDHGDGDDD